MKLIKKQESKDGSIKYAFEIPKKGIVEAIYFNFEGHYGKPPVNSKVICLSSQIGFNIKCSFCETGKMKKVSNLTSEEMSFEVKYIQKDLKKNNLPNAKFYAIMGMGEPLNNLDNVMEFFHKNRKDVKRISISTSGVIPNILNLANDKSHDLEFFISLHSPLEAKRDKLVPINKVYPIKKLLSAGKEYSKKKKEKVNLTYMLIPNVNDNQIHAKELAEIVDPKYFSIQLTCFNPSVKKDGHNSRKNFAKKVPLFIKELEKKGIDFDIQLSRGLEVDGGCGQFSAKLK